jgi:hypothetical protein
MKTNIDSVRQILMNELGFTKESVRLEMEKIVEVEVAKKLKDSSYFEAFIDRAVRNYAKEYSYSKDEIRLAIGQEAAKKAREIFDKHYGEKDEE